MANTLTVHFPEIWAKEFIDRLDAENKMLQLVNRSCESDLASGGDTVRRMKTGAVTTAAYVDGSDMTVTDVVSTDDTLVLNNQRYFLIHLEETELKKSDQPEKIIKAYADQGVYQLSNDIELHILSTMASEVDAGNILGTDGAPISLTKDNIEDWLLELSLKLDDERIPSDNRVYTIDPYTQNLMRKAEIMRETPAGDTARKTGKVGEFNGCDVVVNNNITTTAGKRNIFLHHKKMFFDIAVRINPASFKTFELPLRHGKSMKGLALYGSNSFHPTAGAMLKRAAS